MIIYTEKFCTPFELKAFASSSNGSLHDLQQFLESKTLRKYTVVDKAFLQELFALIDYSNNFSTRITSQLSDLLDELLENNQQLKVKWAKHIELFDL